MRCFMTREGESLIGVENVETTYFDNCAFVAASASFLLQFCLIHISLASLAFCATYFTFLSGVFVFFLPVGIIHLNIATTSDICVVAV